MKKKTGVLILNLGTPDSDRLIDVYKYVTPFLNDPRVIDTPWLSRTFLVNLFIIPFRIRNSTKIYKMLFRQNNGVAPLIEYGYGLLGKLEQRFVGEDVTFELAMRYRNPSMEEVCARMEKENYDEIIILPLFPQYASSSSGSAVEKAMKLIRKWYVIPELKIIGQYWDNEGYINTIVEQAKKYNLDDYDHFIFSYHGLPNSQVDKAHPSGKCNREICENEINHDNKWCYRATSYATTRLIAAKLGIKREDYTVCFQSRLDNEWLEPFSDRVVEEWGKKGAKKLLVFSPAFAADCLETTIEIGDEYQEIFEKLGGEKIDLVESLNDHPMWVDTCEELIRSRM